MSDVHNFVRIGARHLTDEEIKDTLPTYDKLLDQIEDIRLQLKENESLGQDLSFVQEQTTNNIAVLGARGSGKSSVLKTLYYDLTKDQNHCNLLLPPIIPENMEKHMTLMSCVLGLLKPMVEQFAHKHKKANEPCPHRKTDLEKQYNRLLETYLRLQEPYQKISVQQYSTESEYLRTMAEVFEASNGLILDFKKFISLLLSEYAQSHNGKQPLLFIFIDDIDLSAYRCADLVKTLLTYLAHPAIVTVLAGDITIFGEALTLNFLRQEEILGKDAMKESYLVEKLSDGEGNLLERKKNLAYDYLKKVLPPTYRHNVMVWSLENRAGFCPKGLLKEADQENTSVLTLEQQLQMLGKSAPLLEHCFCTVEIDGTIYRPKMLYHLFDSTARGLINAYSVLQQFIENQEDGTFREKLLLEALISSNYQLNIYKDLLLMSVIHFGADAESSHVYFDNFTSWLEKLEQQNKQPDALSLFRLFVFLDFAARLLNDKEAFESDFYHHAKNKALMLACSVGKISEKQFELLEDEKRLIRLIYQSDIFTIFNSFAKEISLKTLFRLPFPLALHYMQIEEPRKNLQDLKREKSYDKEEDIFCKVDCLNNFLGLLEAYYSTDSDKAQGKEQQVQCLKNCPEMFALMENLLHRNAKAFLISAIASQHFVKQTKDDTSNKIECSPLYKIYACDEIILENYITNYQQAEQTESSGGEQYQIENIVLNDAAIQDILSFDAKNSKSILWSKNLHQDVTFSKLFLQNWLSLFYEINSAAATPFYNYYREMFYQDIQDSSEFVLPLSIYESQQIEPYFLQRKQKNEKEAEKEKKRQQMKKILLAVDAIGWRTNLDDEDEESESPIAFIKKYIERELKITENHLQENIWPICAIDISCILTAKENFFNVYKGATNTLAKRCQLLLESFLEEDVDQISLEAYISLYIILKAFLNTRAQYGKPEARALLNALNDAQWICEVQDKAFEETYQFWFHCYCRFRQAELADKVDLKIASLHQYKHLLEEVWAQQDNTFSDQYLKELQRKTGLEQTDMEALLPLFA